MSEFLIEDIKVKNKSELKEYIVYFIGLLSVYRTQIHYS